MSYMLSLFIFFIISFNLYASNILSWQDCLKETVQQNPELKASMENVLSLGHKISSSRGAYLPKISSAVGYTKSETAAGIQADRYSASLTASQNLFAGLQDMAQIQQGEANLRFGQASYRAIKAKISYDLKSAFEGLAYAQQFKKLTAEIIRRREDNIKLVTMRYGSGRENKGSVLLSQAYLSQARYDDLQAQMILEVAKSQLARVLSRDEYSDIVVSGNAPEGSVAGAENFFLLAKATPDFEQIVATQDASKAGLTLSQSAFFPSLDVSGGLSRLDDKFFPNQESWSIGINLTIPLFDGLRDFHSTKSASALYRQAVYNVANTDKVLVAKLKQAYANFRLAQEKFVVDTNFLKATSLRAEIARSKYNNGLLTFEDWDIIEGDLIARQKNYLQSKRDKVISAAQWEQAQGIGAIP